MQMRCQIRCQRILVRQARILCGSRSSQVIINTEGLMSVSHAGAAPTPAHCTPPPAVALAQSRWSGGRKSGTRCSLSRTCKCIPASFPPVTSKGLPPQMCMKIQQQVQTHKNANVNKRIALNWRATIYVRIVVFFNNVFQWVNDRAI